MKKRYAFFTAWLLLAGLLYFFENNTGTRIILASSLLLPFVPAIRRSLSGQDAARRLPGAVVRTFRSDDGEEADEPDGVRVYLPGDPVNRIHWKLSAKRDKLLLREPAENPSSEKEEAVSGDEAAAGKTARQWLLLSCFCLIVLSVLLLLLVPQANQGMKALLNRLFAASEAVNAYAYVRFTVPDVQPVVFAAVLLSAAGLSLAGAALLSRSRLPSLGLMAGVVLFQVYFGLSLPAWAHVLLFTLFVLRMLRRPRNRKAVRSVLAGMLIVSVAILLLWPGVDAATEAASEDLRDRLSQAVQSFTGAARELPEGENETRHVHTRSLTAGDREAQPDREYRLVTVEEEQIAMPHWVSYLRIILLLILTAALVILPFLPFLLLNRQRKKALDARKVFQSEDVRQAVFAIFQHVTAWLEATGNGGGNAPYAAWRADLSPDYPERFAACEKLFEEAAYSTHVMKEEHRQQLLALLAETERTLQQRAGWRQRLRLRYRECLWV